jgi:nucleoside-diphosphate-sugar epimerase
MRGQRVLVTGASGFLGTRLLAVLREAGAAVAAVSRTPRASTSEVAWHQADLAQPEAAARVFDTARPEVVFHLASLVTGRRGIELVGPAFRANLATSVNVLVEASRAGCRRVVLAGSMEEPEADEPAGSPYAVAKGAQALYARFFHALYATPVVTARIFMVYGEGQGDVAKVIPYSILEALAGRAPKLSSGARPVDWIHVTDVAEGLLALAGAAKIEGRRCDLGSGQLVTVREVAERICLMVGGPPPEIGVLPDRPLERVRRADIEATTAQTGFRPRIPLAEGLARTIAWYRAERAWGRL